MWTPVNEEHPKLKQVKMAHPNIHKDHPKHTLLFAEKSDFGYWLWVPISPNYYGPCPRQGIEARVEKV